MATEQTPEPSNVILQRFFETSESARKAATHLRSAAEVGVQFTDVKGDFRFTLVDGRPRFLDGKAKDPDFELTMAPGAVTAAHRRAGPAEQDWGEAAQRADQADHARLGRRDVVGRRQGPRLAGVQRSQGPFRRRARAQQAEEGLTAQ